ncbi:MAG: hypothetical protein ACLQJ7_17370 [Syntrophobacteraceae bacterium]
MAENELRTLFLDLVTVVKHHHRAGNGVHTDLLQRVDDFLKFIEREPQFEQGPAEDSPKGEEAAGEDSHVGLDPHQGQDADEKKEVLNAGTDELSK